jgi:two-component system osmolarity sensor histidine kinase EnvZ
MNPPKLLVLVFIVTVLLSLLTAWVLARRITQPLASFSEAAQRVGDGDIPDALPETGIKELTGFANAFNRMVWQVRALLASRTTMLAGISHDLRTPLARMRLAIEMLPENSAPVLIDHLKKDLAQMDQLIGEFLTLSRDLGKETPQSIELNTFIEELVAEINYGGGAIEFSAQSPLVVQAGPLALRRIVNNLMSNALRYGEGNPIEIAFEIRSKQVLIQIKDRGLGIPQAELENVFRPFYRLESSRNTETGGSGLGLALCRQLAEANGWKIELLPREGGGITAQLSVPLTKVE